MQWKTAELHLKLEVRALMEFSSFQNSQLMLCTEPNHWKTYPRHSAYSEAAELSRMLSESRHAIVRLVPHVRFDPPPRQGRAPAGPQQGLAIQNQLFELP
jgi:hypothetical protein